MNKYEADMLRRGDSVTIAIAEGGIEKHGGKRRATVVKVGRNSLIVRLEEDVDIPLDDLEHAIVHRRAGETGALAEITPSSEQPSHVRVLTPAEYRELEAL